MLRFLVHFRRASRATLFPFLSLTINRLGRSNWLFQLSIQYGSLRYFWYHFWIKFIFICHSPDLSERENKSLGLSASPQKFLDSSMYGNNKFFGLTFEGGLTFLQSRMYIWKVCLSDFVRCLWILDLKKRLNWKNWMELLFAALRNVFAYRCMTRNGWVCLLFGIVVKSC